MLQGFYWNSYDDTKWTNLESQADELSEYFNLIWVPNSAKDAGNPSMGYMPVYWFTNHNSSFGTEAEIRHMIQTFNAKGVGIIEDVVINHRAGVSNWTNFPAEEWNGKTYQLGPEHICCTDEVSRENGEAKPTGAADTGDDFNAARDLDHTNATVQENCKAYCQFLLQDMGYAGFRYDMVKGYRGEYVKIYNQASKPTYSVGEYWDASYDNVANWIEATGKESAAFDFPFKYAVNEAFSSENMSKLAWRAPGGNNQPAGMIHYGYGQYAVTFIENHDTARDGSKFPNPDKVLAANAFMLASPGTPCIFLRHWLDHKEALIPMIAARNEAGVTNTSVVTVIKATNNCYMAEIQGTNGRLAVKIGSAMETPEGYTEEEQVAKGNDYCMWLKEETVVIPDEPEDMPSQLYIIGNIDGHSWDITNPVQFTQDGTKFTAENVTLVDAGTPEQPNGKAYFAFTSTKSDWDNVNANRYGASVSGSEYSIASATTFVKQNTSFTIVPGTYDFVVDFATNTFTATPVNMYLIGTVEGHVDDIATPVQFTRNGSKFTAENVTLLEASDVSGKARFAFSSTIVTNGDLTYLNNHRFAFAANEKTDYTIASTQTFAQAYNGSFLVRPGTYDFEVDFSNNTFVVTPHDVYVIGSLNKWNTADGQYRMTKNGAVYTLNDFTLQGADDQNSMSYFSFTTTLGADWDAVNKHPRFTTANTNDKHDHNEFISDDEQEFGVREIAESEGDCFCLEDGKYDLILDLANKTFKAIPEYHQLYIWHVNTNGQWVETPIDDNGTCSFMLYTTSEQPEFYLLFAEPKAHTAAVRPLDDSSDPVTVKVKGVQFGTDLEPNTDYTAKTAAYENHTDAANGFKTPGFYTVSLGRNDGQWTLRTSSIQTGIEDVNEEPATEAAIEFFNLQGQRVANPTSGLYIMRQGNKAQKVYIR